MSKSIIEQVKAARAKMNIKEDMRVEDKILSDGLSACIDQFKAKGWDGEGELSRVADRLKGAWSDEDLIAYLSVETAADLASNMSDRMIEQQMISRPSWLSFCVSSLLQRCFLPYARSRRMVEESLQRALDRREEVGDAYAGTQATAFNEDDVDEAFEAMSSIADQLSELYGICAGLAAEPLRPLSLSMDEDTMDIDRAYQLYAAFVADFKAASKREYVASLKAQNKAALNSGMATKESVKVIQESARAEENKISYEKQLASALKEGRVQERNEYRPLTSSSVFEDDIEEVMYTNGQ